LSRLDAAAWREVVAEASRAPSVHNVQPGRWRLRDDGHVELLRALDRSLPAADPSGRDVRASVGAAFEGTALALSRRGLGLSAPTLLDEPAGPGLVRVAVARVVDGVTEDPLAAWMGRRRAFRGVFARPTTELIERLGPLAADDVNVVTDVAAIAWLARAYDAANSGFLSQPAFEAELYSWLRLAPTHPGWDRDGLTAPCLALSPLEARAAQVLLRPAVFPWLRRAGFAGALLSEARAIRSAAAVLLFTAPRGEDVFHTGRRFHRLWLEVTRAGAALCPLSSLADHEPTAHEVGRRFGIEAGRRLVNAFRVGVAPGEPAASPRLPVTELIVQVRDT